MVPERTELCMSGGKGRDLKEEAGADVSSFLEKEKDIYPSWKTGCCGN